MVAANVVVAEREAEARRLFTSLQLMSLYTLRGSPVTLPPPVDDLKRVASAAEIEAINHMFTYSFVGTPETVKSELQAFLKMTRADELIVSNPIFDHTARLRSLELTALIRGSERSG
jgi:alkanesulfonate monooxygenase SsuD/methylene tetrahydromethanopterin reductase-like flavin-dependent oxidoreductase (luciferase family)